MSNQSIKNAFERMWQHSKNEFVGKDEISGLINSNEFIRKDNLDFTYDFETQTWNADPTKKYMGNIQGTGIKVNLNSGKYLLNGAEIDFWFIEGKEIGSIPSVNWPMFKQTITTSEGRIFTRVGTYDGWTPWSGDIESPRADFFSKPLGQGFLLGYNDDGTYPVPATPESFNNSVVIRDSKGKIYVKQHPENMLEPTSKYYVDTNRVKVANNDRITKTIKFGDLEWEDGDIQVSQVTNNMLGIRAPIDLGQTVPANSKITINFVTTPTDADINTPFALEAYTNDPNISTVTGNMNVERIEILESEYFSQNVSPLGLMTTTWESGTFVNSSWNIISPYEIVTTGDTDTLYLFIVEETMGIRNMDEFVERYSNVQISVEYVSGDYNEQTPSGAHVITLRSDTEIHYNYPVTELTITGFESVYNPIATDDNGNTIGRVFPEEYSETWTVSFVAGDIMPLVILPEDVYFAGAEPIFEPGIFYYLTFKKFLNKYLCFWTTFGEGALYV